MALSRSFFCQPREPHPFIENFQDILMIEIKMREHHQCVKPEIRYLINQSFCVAARSGVLSRQYDLGGFFSDFLQDLIQSLCVQRGHIGAVR